MRVILAAILCLLGLSACGGGDSISIFSPGALPASTPTPVSSGSTPPVPGTPTFPTGGSGNCKTGIYFTGANQTAVIPLTEQGYSGAFTATSSAPAVVSTSVNGSTVTLSAIANGTAYITFKDANNNSQGCNAAVTITTGTVS